MVMVNMVHDDGKHGAHDYGKHGAHDQEINIHDQLMNIIIGFGSHCWF